MQLDFSEVDDLEVFASVPEGVYACRVSEVREGETRDGDARWAFRLEVLEGDHAGRTAAWDGISFGERGLRRAKHVLEKMGFDVGAPLELAAGDLEGVRVFVEVELEDREDPLTGKRQIRPRVPFQGYEPYDGDWTGPGS